MKITNDTQIGNGNKNNRALNAGAKAVGYAFGGKEGAKIASNVVKSKPVQDVASALGKKKQKTSDIGENKIKNSLANKSRNVFNFNRRKKKENQNSSNSDSSVSNASESLDTSDVLNNEKEKIKAHVKRAIVRKIIIIVLPIFVFLLLLAAIVGTVASIFPFLIPDLDSGEKQIVSDASSENYEKEQAYYDKLQEVKENYTNKCGGEFNISFIHSTLIYLYYQTSYEDADYDKMRDMVDVVVGEIPDVCNVDYKVNGDFYNNLKNNSSFRDYYSVLLEERTMDEILSQVFELGNELNIENDSNDKTFISEDTKVDINSSNQKNNLTNVSNNLKNGSSSITLKEYLAGIVYANSENLSDSSKTKALIIAYTTNVLNNNFSINSQMASIDNSINYCSIVDGCSYTKNHQLQSGPGERENGNNVLYGGKYYYKAPLSSSEINNLDSNINSVYGNVLTSNNDIASTVDINKVLRISGDDYKDMLSRAYPELTLKDIIENNYANDLDYGPRKVATEVIFYEQRDYSDTPFCHRKSNSLDDSIGKAGCGITAMAIVASTYENSRKYDPIYMNERAYQLGQCGSSDGTFTGFFGRQARAMGYQHLSVGTKKNSDKQQVLNHLSQGHLIVARMGRGMFTNSGHYIVLSGIDPATKKVYVHDPYNRINKKIHNSGNGWYSFNSIVKQAKEFYIIWKG